MEDEMIYNVKSIDITDEELVEYIKNKDYEKVVMSFSKVVSKYCHNRYGDDIKQEVYLKLLTSWVNKKNIKNWKAYLYSCIKNYSYKLIKYKYNYTNMTEKDANRLQQLNSKCDLTEDEEIEMALLNNKRNIITSIDSSYDGMCCIDNFELYYLLSTLKEIISNDEYDLIYMYYIDKYTYDEIGNKLDITKSAVKKKIDKIINKIKNNEKFLNYF